MSQSTEPDPRLIDMKARAERVSEIVAALACDHAPAGQFCDPEAERYCSARWIAAEALSTH